jgi:NhaP-type Na+/H+ or K+/H+ antiporter
MRFTRATDLKGGPVCVLEGALDLRLAAGRRRFLVRTFASSLLGVALTTTALAMVAEALFGLSWGRAFLAAAPFGVISSAVAIPSADALAPQDREFVIYESSWSDILGVMGFNALLLAERGGPVTAHVLLGSVAVVLAGGVIALAVWWLVGHLEGHVKFLPLLFALLLVYTGAEALHLSPLLIVLILGLVLNNAHVLERFRWLRRLRSPHYDAELARPKHLTAEATFLVRTFFFLLLGYVTPLNQFADAAAWGSALVIVALIFGLRWCVLKLDGQPRALGAGPAHG